MAIENKLAVWAKGGISAPQRVLLYPTNKCNLRCVFCYQQLKPYDYSDSMPKKKWVSLTKELCAMGVEVLQISGGGEPMLVWDTVLEMMKVIKQHNVRGRLVTNGTVWKEKWVKHVIKLGWDDVIFSIDGHNANTHNMLRGVDGAFEKTVSAIKMFRDYKKECGGEKPRLEFSTVLCKANFKHVSDIIRLAHDLGVKIVTFEPVFVSNPYVHEIKLNKEQRIFFINEVIPSAMELANSLGVVTNLSRLIKLEVIEETGNLKKKVESIKYQDRREGLVKKFPFIDSPCFEPWLWPKIEADGRIGPCSTNMLKEENIKNKTFKEVWCGKHFTEFRNLIMKNKLPEGCSNCVSTHLPLNMKVRKKLVEHLMKNG